MLKVDFLVFKLLKKNDDCYCKRELKQEALIEIEINIIRDRINTVRKKKVM